MVNEDDQIQKTSSFWQSFYARLRVVVFAFVIKQLTYQQLMH